MIRLLLHYTENIFRAMSKSEPVFYAVKRGRVPGIYSTWSECEKQVKGFSCPSYKKFSAHTDACEFLAKNVTASTPSTSQQSSKDESHIFQVNSKNMSQILKESSATNSCCPTDAFREIKKEPSAIATSCQCNQNAVEIVSLNAAVESMKASLGNIMEVVQSLTAGLAEVRSSIFKFEKTLFIAPGSKRSFSTSTLNANNDDQTKRPKFDTKANHFTGSKFNEIEGTHVYTDGGCFDNGRNGARAGIGVFWTQNDPDNVSERLPGRPTNNRAEIHAAVRAVQIAKNKGIKNLVLHTDSQFLINGITKWIRGWKRNQWRKTTGSPVINQKDFEELDRELKGISVKWVYVRGHSGDPSNEGADLLAKQGAEKLE